MRHNQTVGLALAAAVVTAASAFTMAHLPDASASVHPRAHSLPSPVESGGRAFRTGDGVELREAFAPGGVISRLPVKDPSARPRQRPLDAKVLSAEVVTIQRSGDSDSNFDLVFVGDGYTEGELSEYHDQVVERWEEMSSIEPFSSLKDKINVWQVNVVSRESGADNDPSYGVSRDTALDGEFNCSGIQRLLCINDSAAQQYAALAPGADQVLALVNSSTYGGSGGRVAVSSGGNSSASQIVMHELGHSIGGLADEYEASGGSGYGTSEPNVSSQGADEMRRSHSKWYKYLGMSTPDGGTIGAYEGAKYQSSGVYRPSQNSIMRTLGQPFNLVGLDAMKAGILAKTR